MSNMYFTYIPYAYDVRVCVRMCVRMMRVQ